MTRCSENLHRLVIEQRLRHPGVAELDRHVANALAKPTPRGWRLVKASDQAQVDAVIALAMSAERVGDHQVENLRDVRRRVQRVGVQREPRSADVAGELPRSSR